jgi:hypothetical protein
MFYMTFEGFTETCPSWQSTIVFTEATGDISTRKGCGGIEKKVTEDFARSTGQMETEEGYRLLAEQEGLLKVHSALWHK